MRTCWQKIWKVKLGTRTLVELNRSYKLISRRKFRYCSNVRCSESYTTIWIMVNFAQEKSISCLWISYFCEICSPLESNFRFKLVCCADERKVWRWLVNSCEQSVHTIAKRSGLVRSGLLLTFPENDVIWCTMDGVLIQSRRKDANFIAQSAVE